MNNKSLYPKRRNLRLPRYDYASLGAYFVTICTKDKRFLLGQIVDSRMMQNRFGEAVASVWKEIPLHYPEINNEVFIVMPNHVHGIIIIQDIGRAGYKPAPTKTHSLSEVVRGFKTYSSRRINEIQKSQGKMVRQRSYYEHVIRNEKDYQKIGEYILFNPSKWETDRNNPDAKLIKPLSALDISA